MFSSLWKSWHCRGCWGRSAQEFVPSLSRGSLKGKLWITVIPRQRETEAGGLVYHIRNCIAFFPISFWFVTMSCKYSWEILPTWTADRIFWLWFVLYLLLYLPVAISWSLHLPSFIILQSYHIYFCIKQNNPGSIGLMSLKLKFCSQDLFCPTCLTAQSFPKAESGPEQT